MYVISGTGQRRRALRFNLYLNVDDDDAPSLPIPSVFLPTMLELEDIIANPALAKSMIDHLTKKTRTLQETIDGYKVFVHVTCNLSAFAEHALSSETMIQPT